MEQQLARYQYVILPARPGYDFQTRKLYNDAYDFWKHYWQRTFKTKAPEFWDPLDFFRQNLVYCLFCDDVLIAQNLSTFVHAEDYITFDLPYFEGFRGEPAAVMKAEGAKRVMTLEYTAVHTGYGERRTGIRFAEVMNGLALNIFRDLNFDATTGTPRRLSGLSEVTANFGYRKIYDGYKKAGWELDVFVGFKGEIKEHPDPKYRSLIRQLWTDRIDYSDLHLNTSASTIPSLSPSLRPNGARADSFYKPLGKEFSMQSNSHSNIRDVYAESMRSLADKFDSFDWTDKATYSLWLAQAYYLVRHTTRLLALCAGYCPFEYEDTHKRILTHLREEEGHEVIALADIKALGTDLSALPESPKTALLTGLQYEQMANISGCAFFGYILLLEGLAVTRGAQLNQIVSEKYGPRVTRFLKTHAEDDVEHIEQAFKQIESFSAKDQQIVINNLIESTRLYHQMLDDVRANISNYASHSSQYVTHTTSQLDGLSAP